MAEESNRMRFRRSGFTLVELMVVIVIIGILAMTVLVNVRGSDDKAKVARVKVDFQSIQHAAELFKLDHGRYPDSLDELMNPPENDDGTPTHAYLDKRPLDPWTKEEYFFEKTEDGVHMISYGRDKQQGGSGYDADIDSEELQQGRGSS